MQNNPTAPGTLSVFKAQSSSPHFHVSQNVEVFPEELGGPTFAAELNEAPGQLVDLQGLGTEKLSLPEDWAPVANTAPFPHLQGSAALQGRREPQSEPEGR